MTPLTLEDVLTTEELDIRVPRSPDYEAENRALVAVAEEMALKPDNILQKLADVILDVCNAESAGVSILEPHNDGDLFRWHAAGGQLRKIIGGSIPRGASPCGVVLERDSVVLFSHPGRYFEAIAQLEPQIEELLLVPFHVDGRPVGTLGDRPRRRATLRRRRFANSQKPVATGFRGISAVRIARSGRAWEPSQEPVPGDNES